MYKYTVCTLGHIGEKSPKSIWKLSLCKKEYTIPTSKWDNKMFLVKYWFYAIKSLKFNTVDNDQIQSGNPETENFLLVLHFLILVAF